MSGEIFGLGPLPWPGADLPPARLPTIVPALPVRDPPPFPVLPTSLPPGIVSFPVRDPSIVPQIPAPQPADIPAGLRPDPWVRVYVAGINPQWVVPTMG